MYLHALTTALPPATYTQTECWEIIRESPVWEQLNRRTRLLLRAILNGESGVATRHFALPDIPNVVNRSPDELNEAFRHEAPKLAGAALQRALDQTQLAASNIDVLLVCTCTGYLCPGVSSYVAEQMGLRPDAQLLDLSGLGCAAALPMLRTAAATLAAQPGAVVAAVAVEVCSAAFYIDDDPGVIASMCLFGDGAAASIWRAEPAAGTPRCHTFAHVHQPQHRDRIRFETRNGRLRNLLDASVPELAADAVERLHTAERARPDAAPIRRLVSHGGGRDVLDALAERLPDYDLGPSRRVLSRCGNMSSPSVLFALEEALRESTPDDTGDWWLTSFGAGFSAHACRLSAGPV